MPRIRPPPPMLAALAATLLLGSAGPGAADPTLPARRAGLWELSVGAVKGMPALRMCMAAGMDRGFALPGAGAGSSCAETSARRTAAGWSFSSRCTDRSGGEVVSEGTLTGDPQTSYRIEGVVRRTGGPRAGESRFTVAARWLGPCPAGSRAGDLVLPGGAVLNRSSALKAR